MSFLVGPLSGALVAGGVYYGFSNLIQTRTEQHIRDLHALSLRMIETPRLVQAPISAATRIKPHPFSSELKSLWNHEIASLFRGFHSMDKAAVEWGKSLLYGPRVEGSKGTQQTPRPSASASS
ncbi:hypothetical protein GALMADRAFT_425347 [Galerina marginata CBS 339.88]|uniref:MICOS complex subunit MIC12 n=1 Tax=Galerina marginata (strain CBS 339.88) TaxID=685588 RepID=A0A067T3X9_GALM3|nr:hypothetical protein GALMADRAFT_425347 [Galerina marginata CBS 339.88]